MSLEGKTIGILITNSFYNFKIMIKELKKFIDQNANIILFIEESFYNTFKEDDFIKEVKHITKNENIHSLQEWDSSEFKNGIDVLIVLPSTSNTIAKLANDITDDFETMIIHHSLKLEKPIVLAISCDDGLSSGAENLGKLLNIRNYYFVPFKQTNPITRNYYFVPFKQTNPITRPRAITFDSSYLYKTIICALNKEQIQPILLSI